MSPRARSDAFGRSPATSDRPSPHVARRACRMPPPTLKSSRVIFRHPRDPAPRLRIAAAFLLFAGCSEGDDTSNRSGLRINPGGESKIGATCAAQSDCGVDQRCVVRSADMASKPPAVESGVCEADTWPGGCFGLLPPKRVSAREAAEMKRKGRKGLPLQVICE